MNYFDLHCDTILKLVENNDDLCGNEYHISLKKAAPIDTYIQFYAVFVKDNFYWDGGGFDNFTKHVEYLQAQVEKHSEQIKFIKTAEDFQDAVKTKGNYAMLSMEGAVGFDGDLDNVRRAKELGCKMATITWNGENHWCFGADYTKGLKPAGRELIKKMNDENMIVDVSHTNDWGMEDILSLSTKPIVASHSNIRSVWPHKRNLSDEHFREIVKRGGLVGLNFYTHFLGGEHATVSDMARHIERMLSLGGENTIAMGSDFDGADLPGELQHIGQVGVLYEHLLHKMNYSQALVDKLFFDNAKTFFANYFKSER